MAEITLVCTPSAAEEAGRRLAAAISRIHEGQGSVRLAIPGGTALAALDQVRRHIGRSDWEGLRLTWADERCVPFSHGDSNRGEAYRRGALDLAHPVGMELPLFMEGETPAEACARVQRALEASFGGGLDLALLGMGEDGHIASLFPGHTWRPLPALVQAVLDSPKPPACRMTLSLPLLAHAEVILVATGESKREALKRLLQGDAALPGAALGPTTVITDLDMQTGGRALPGHPVGVKGGTQSEPKASGRSPLSWPGGG